MGECWAKPLDGYVTVDDSVLLAPTFSGLESLLAAAREGLKHLPSENKQEFAVEPYHSQILWQIHQLAADVICIQDYCNLSMSGKQPNLVSDGRSGFQFALQEGLGIWLVARYVKIYNRTLSAQQPVIADILTQVCVPSSFS